MRHDIIEYVEISSVIGRTVTVTVDRPLGSYHPEHKDMYYPTDEVVQVAWMNREQIKELFDANMFVDTLEYFFTEVDK